MSNKYPQAEALVSALHKFSIWQDDNKSLLKENAELCEKLAELEAKNQQLTQWVSDCQSGMYINCVYCGHRYGPQEDTPVAMADVLREHIEKCPKHPLSEARAKLAEAEAVIAANLHIRLCWGCGLEFWAKDGMVPYCLCPNCGSQDTRRQKREGE